MPARYLAGYQNIITTDSTRIYKPGTSQSEKLHYRPIEIDVWYPAKESPIPILLSDMVNFSVYWNKDQIVSRTIPYTIRLVQISYNT